MATILVVEDEVDINNLIRTHLEQDGHTVIQSFDGPTALALVEEHNPQLIILDWMLPGMDGLAVCREVRRTHLVPIIMLTARGEEADRIIGLELGADDYVAKPFSPRELLARVKAVLRRAAAPLVASEERGLLAAAGLELDEVAHEVHLHGALIALTAKEFDLLAHLMRHPRRAFRREELLEAIWGFRCGDTSTVTVHVRRLREKIEVDPSAPRLVRTVRGVGYRFEPSGADG